MEKQFKILSMRLKGLFIIALILLVSCTNQVKDNEFSNSIDIETGLENLTTLKVSDFGKTIRYVPLETTDDCLIGNNPTVKVLKNHIVVEVNRRCLLFDKKDGSFISEIGHAGQDPEAFNNPTSWTDEKEEFLYFNQYDKLIKYDMKGHFAGKIDISSPPGLATHYLLTDTEIISYYSGINNSRNYSLSFFDNEGILKDTIPQLLSKQDETNTDILSISVLRNTNIWGNWTKSGTVIIEYKDDKKQIMAPDAETLWNYNGNIRFKETFIDTIYTITDRKLTPSIAFKTGKWSWPENERTSKRNNSERIFISFVSENNDFMFFQCIKGLYTDESTLYNGLYNKKTGETKMNKYSDDIKDDLTEFMPFKPLSASTSGDFFSFIEAFDIIEWVEKHPEAKNNSKLSFLKNFNDDMNPVIVLVE